MPTIEGKCSLWLTNWVIACPKTLPMVSGIGTVFGRIWALDVGQGNPFDAVPGERLNITPPHCDISVKLTTCPSRLKFPPTDLAFPGSTNLMASEVSFAV